MSKTLIGGQLGLNANNFQDPIEVKSRLSTNTHKNQRERLATDMGVTSSESINGPLIMNAMQADIDSSAPENGVPMIVTADPLAQNSI